MKTALVAAFAVIIALPLAANVAGRDGADPGAENRQLAAFPAPASPAQFGAGLTHWFDDHFGFRSTLIKGYGEERLFGLGVSPTSAVIKGDDGWFFYADDNAIDDYASTSLMTDAAIANWRAALVDANRWLQRKGIAYVFTIAPDKHAVYPEMMPASIVRVNALSRTDQLFTALQDTALAVDVRPALADAKARERVYQKTDTHWNDRGAFAAYTLIIGAAHARLPAVPPPLSRDDFMAASRDVISGDLAGMMGLKRVLREEDLVLVPKISKRAQVVEPAGAAPTAEEGRLVTEIPGSTLPRAVIFRDSFVSRLVPFLSEHFSRAVYLWQNDFDADDVEKENPDIVIQEIVGRHLYGFIPSPELIPR